MAAGAEAGAARAAGQVQDDVAGQVLEAVHGDIVRRAGCHVEWVCLAGGTGAEAVIVRDHQGQVAR